MQIDTIEYRGFNINIHQDEFAEDPRTWSEPAGKMVCFHKRYDLGDKHNYSADTLFDELAIEANPRLEDLLFYIDNDEMEDPDATAILAEIDPSIVFDNETNPREKIIEKIVNENYIILDLYLYDHGGITMRTSPFSDPWDSGRVGIIFIAKEQAKKEGWSDEQAEKYLKGEVQEYDYFLTGQVYGYVIEPTDRNKKIECNDSCWGFYGDTDYMLDEAKEIIDSCIVDYKNQCIVNHRQKLETEKFIRESWAL